jgi:pyruvate/2-oxoglutarate/acetoin dehydrogenase E1 component
MKRGGIAAEIAFRLNEAAPDLVKTLRAPIKRVTALNVALPHGVELEKEIVPPD